MMADIRPASHAPAVTPPARINRKVAVRTCPGIQKLTPSLRSDSPRVSSQVVAPANPKPVSVAHHHGMERSIIATLPTGHLPPSPYSTARMRMTSRRDSDTRSTQRTTHNGSKRTAPICSADPSDPRAQNWSLRVVRLLQSTPTRDVPIPGTFRNARYPHRIVVDLRCCALGFRSTSDWSQSSVKEETFDA